jgi:hypothetical protein
MWYHFWKIINRNGNRKPPYNGETYKYYENTPSEGELQDDCLYWAESVSGGENYGFEYNFEEISHPPLNWIQDQIKDTKSQIESLKEHLQFLQSAEHIFYNQ